MSIADDEVTRSIGPPDVADVPRIGPYRVIREIGRGGMGSVYLAVRADGEILKRVAIKVLKRGMDTDGIIRRFRKERQILASLEHPYIASLFDGGSTPDGLPYFAMEYVEGQTIAGYCESRELDTSQRLELFRKVCAAVQHAHQNLIIHRDIKPGNVLVAADGTPKLLDFGIAKLLNAEPGADTMAPTGGGAQLMTPEYASPEQVRGETITTATDVYSLGVLLYELLTGRRPYRLTSRSPAEIANVVCNSVPVRPSTVVTQAPVEGTVVGGLHFATGGTAASGSARARSMDPARLRRRLAGDLDTIVLKALSKDPLRRYASVDQFSEDVRRHLAGLPVIARRDTIGYRAAKFVRRNRVAVVAALLTFVALVAGIIGTTWQARAARRERARAEQRFDDVRRLANSFLFELHDAIRDLPGSTPARHLLVMKALEYLDKLAGDGGDRADLQRDLAGAYLKVGDVQGRPLNPNLGDTTGALDSYRKATALYEKIGAATSPDPALGRELGTAYVRMSEVLSAAGHTSDALAYARRAVDLQKALAEKSATGAAGAVPMDLRRELAASYSRVGDLLSATGDTQGALEQRRLALALMETLYANAPNDVNNIRQLGVAYQKMGNSLGNPNYPNVGDFAGALKHLERSDEVFRNGVAAHPSNAVFRRNAAVIDSNTADVLIALERPDEALARQRHALAEFKALSAADPTNVAASNDVAISQSKIAEMLYSAGRAREAIEEYDEALRIHLRLAAADPANDSLKLEVASDYNRLATAQTGVGDRAAALANHDKAVAMSRELYAANPSNVELKVAVALALTGRGDAWVRFARRSGSARDDLTAAEKDYGEGVDLLEALEKAGTIGGTDLDTLAAARKELARIRDQLKQVR